jgi:hypothetical protein
VLVESGVDDADADDVVVVVSVAADTVVVVCAS